MRDEQVLSMEATLPEGDAAAARGEEGASGLTVAAIYGANGSGKSNVLAGLRFMRDAVVRSHRLWQPDGGVPREPFGWGEKASNPSLYEVTFIEDGVRYQYGFVADADTTTFGSWRNGSTHSRAAGSRCGLCVRAIDSSSAST